MQTLTGEIAFFDGTVQLQGSLCYVPQEPCKSHHATHHRNVIMSFVIGIFSSTIKKNILFGKDFDANLFRRVVHATELDAVRVHDIFFRIICW